MKIEVKKRGVQQLRIVDIKIPKSSSSLTTVLINPTRTVGVIYREVIKGHHFGLKGHPFWIKGHPLS